MTRWYKYHREHSPEVIILQQARTRAKRNNQDFNLDLADIVLPNFCPILGIPIVFGAGKPVDGSPTLDRVDNDKGYIKGNVAIISYKANRIKNNGTLEDHKQIVKYMEQYL